MCNKLAFIHRIKWVGTRTQSKSWLFLLIELCFGFTALSAQTPSYIHYEVQDGLPSNLVYCCYQDKSGVMWFGTNKGLASFDGMRFKVYGTKDGLPDSEILGLWEDSQERLWIAHFWQQPSYRKNGFFYTSHNDTLLKKLSQLTSAFTFFETKEGYIKFAGLKRQAITLKHSNNYKQLFSSSVAKFAYLRDDLFALTTNEIVHCDKDGSIECLWTFHPTPHSYQGCSVSGNRLLYSLPDRLLLFEWDGKNLSLVDKKICNLSGQVFTDSKGRFWVCSQKVGAVCFENDMHNMSNPVTYLAGKKIMAMSEDTQGTYWFCTADEGLYALPQYSPMTFLQSNSSISCNITAINIDKNNQTWAADNEGHLFFISNGELKKTWRFSLTKGYNLCRQITESSNSDILIVADDHLYSFDGYKFNVIMPNFSAFKSIIYGSKGLWYICYSHLGFLSTTPSKHEIWYDYRRNTAIGEDFQGNLWVGRPNGLFSSPDSLAYNWGDRFPILKARVSAIQSADINHLWVVTSTSGLLWVEIDNREVKSVEVVNEHITKPIENIQSIYKAVDGRVWMATNHGVYGLNTDWTVLHFDHYDGLAADDVNSVVVKGDTLWAGTVSGLTRLVFSSSLTRSDFPTVISALRYRLSDKVYQFNLLDSVVDRRLTILPADTRLIEFDLSALDYCSRGKIQFKYTFQSELLPWYYWTPENLVRCALQSFKNTNDTLLLESGTLSLGVQINPGRYHLQVVGISSSGLLSEIPTEWTLLMRPYWYQTIWAILVLWGLTFWGIGSYLKAREENKALSLKVSRLQLQSLQTQINPHFIGNSVNALQQFFYPFDSKKASRYISLFTRLLRKTMNISDKAFIPLSEEITYLQDYLSLVKMRLGDRFDFAIKGNELLSPDLPFPVMLLQPLVENATIHGLSPDNQSFLMLDFQYSNGLLTTSILDNGVGIRTNLASNKRFFRVRKSKGLELITKKIQALNHLYGMDIQLSISDRAADQPVSRGTRVSLSFHPAMSPEFPD